MKKYNKPSITVTTYVTVTKTNLKLEVSAPIALDYYDTNRISGKTHDMNDLNS